MFVRCYLSLLLFLLMRFAILNIFISGKDNCTLRKYFKNCLINRKNKTIFSNYMLRFRDVCCLQYLVPKMQKLFTFILRRLLDYQMHPMVTAGQPTDTHKNTLILYVLMRPRLINKFNFDIFINI